MADLVVSLQTSLQGAAQFWASLPFLPLLVGHCLFCATMAPEAKPNFLLHFWMTYLGGFAGGILSSIVLMNPAKAPISLLSSNRSGLTYTACWWLMTYSPLAPLLNYIYNIKPVKMASKACVAYMRANLVLNRVLIASDQFKGIYMAPILIGTLASCGGKCSFDAIKSMYGLSTGPAEFTVPTYSFRSAFFGSVLFYLSSLCPFTQFLTTEEAAGAIISLFVLQSVIFDLGLPFDWSDLLLRLVLGVSNIPYPAGVPQAIKPAPASSKSKAKQVESKVQDTTPTATLDTSKAKSTAPSAAANNTNGLPGSYPTAPDATAYGASSAGDAAELLAALEGLAGSGEEQGGEAGAKKARRKKKAAGGEGHNNGWQVVTGRQRRSEPKKTQ